MHFANTLKMRACEGLLVVGALCGGVAMAALIMLSAGCATVAERPALAQLAVQYATIKVLADHPERAARVVEIARYVRESAGSESAATVALLEVAVRKQIDFTKLDTADAMLVDALILMVRDELVARLGSGVLSPEQALVVGQVAGWIESAARAYSPPQPTAAVMTGPAGLAWQRHAQAPSSGQPAALGEHRATPGASGNMGPGGLGVVPPGFA